jgi:hypothetical protein
MAYDALDDYFERASRGRRGNSDTLEQVMALMGGGGQQDSLPPEPAQEEPPRSEPIDYSYLNRDADTYRKVLKGAAPGLVDFVQNAPENFLKGLRALGGSRAPQQEGAGASDWWNQTPQDALTGNMYGRTVEAPMQDVKPGASEAEVNKAMVSLLKTKAAEAGEAEKRHKVERQNATHDLLTRLQAQSSPGTQSFVVRGSKRDPGGKGDIILSSPGGDENKGSYSKYVNRVGEYDKATLKEQGVPTDVAYLADKLETSAGPKAALQFLMERLSPQVPIEQRMAELQSKSRDPAAMNPIIKAIFMRNGWTKEMIDEYFGGKKE